MIKDSAENPAASPLFSQVCARKRQSREGSIQRTRGRMKLRQTNGTEAQIIITVHRTRGRMKLHPTNGTEIPSDDGASREGPYGTAPDGRNRNLNGVMHDNHDYKRDNASVNRRDNPIGRSASPVKGHSMGNTVRSSQSDSLKVIPRTVRTDRSRG